MSLNFLVIGSGARENAIAYSLKSSKISGKLYLASPNDGFRALGEEIEYSDWNDLAEKSKKNGVDIAIVGAENPLADGIVDIFKAHTIPIVGTSKFWSQLESSKLFAKNFMEKHKIKTADYEVFTDPEMLEKLPYKSTYVVKANGLCAGKGVFVTTDRQKALSKATSYLNGEFKEQSTTVLSEDFLDGEELSLICLYDGKTLLPFMPARDFKRLSGDINTPNTGGMGAYCPVKLTKNQNAKLDNYTKNLENALLKEKADFVGFIYAGLIWYDEDFYTLEFNVRLGDPEAQVLLSHLENDFGELLYSAINQKLGETKLKWKTGTTAALVVASEGYPTCPQDGELIKIPKDIAIQIFFAGVEKRDGGLFSKGGRVLSLVATGDFPFEKLYQESEEIQMKHKYVRKNIHT